MSSGILLYEIAKHIIKVASFLDESLLEIMISQGRGKKSSFNALPRSAGLFSCNRESIPEKMRKPGQNILIYTLIFFFPKRLKHSFTLSKSDE